MIKPEAVLFDLDGVLCDTSEYHFLAWKRLAGELSLHFTREDNERLKGVSRLHSFEIILEINGRQTAYSEDEKNRLANHKNAYYRDLIEQMGPANILPGIRPFLSACRHAQLRLAVASASKNAHRVLERIGLSDAFDYVADAAQIKFAKPDPEVFLDCAQALHVPPGRCIGIEDAQAGIQAIHAAGMFSVGIGVQVTSLAPDLLLASTRELNLTAIMDRFSAIKGEEIC